MYRYFLVLIVLLSTDIGFAEPIQIDTTSDPSAVTTKWAEKAAL